MTELISTPDSAVLSDIAAENLDLVQDEALEFTVGGVSHSLTVDFIPETDNSLLPDNLILTDISTAQTIFTRVGKLDRIDLSLDLSGEKRLADWLPDDVQLVPSAAKGNALDQMTRAFRINLTAMSLLAMLVSAFLVYNTMTFSVLQRRQQFATERMLGVTGVALAVHIVIEAVLLALAGAVMGCVLGVLLGQGLLLLVTRTISDLYTVIDYSVLTLNPLLLVKGFGLTTVAVLLATVAPALEAARIPPVNVHRRSSAEFRSAQISRVLPWIGIVLCCIGIALLQVQSRSLIWGFISLFLLVIAYSFFIPLLTELFLRFAGWIAPNSSILWNMAVRGIQASRSRTLLAITALAIAVSATVGVGVMISSFRLSVSNWLEMTLQSDIYVATLADRDAPDDKPLPSDWPEKISSIDGVASISTGQTQSVTINGLPVPMLILDPGTHSENGFRLLRDSTSDVWSQFEAGESILISESLSWHHKLEPREELTINSLETGDITVSIGGIYQDYSASQGMIVLSRKLFEKFWKDQSFSSIGLHLSERADIEWIRMELDKLAASSDGSVVVRSNVDIKQRSLSIFDQTFAITGVLRVLVVLVAFVGVFSALMAMSLEKTRDYSVLRASGMTISQLVKLVLLQTGLTGLIAGVLALPPGWAMSEILISVINQRSFGWTMDRTFPPVIVIQAIALSTFAALIAGIYPTRRIASNPVSNGLREI